MTAVDFSLSPGRIAENVAVAVDIVPACGRLIIRARSAVLDALGTVVGLTLPTRIGDRACADGIDVLCLGPDEWTLKLPESRVNAMMDACEVAHDNHAFSVVDVSGREVSVRIEGQGALDLLTIGCPRDIDSIKVGGGCRTIFDGVTVVIWRDADKSFQIDVWNSFAPHLLELLTIGCAEIATDAGFAGSQSARSGTRSR